MDRPRENRRLPKWWRWAAAALAGLIVLIALALSLSSERSYRVPARNLTIATVENGVFHDFIPLRGRVVPNDTIYVDAAAGGRVEKILAAPGDRVAAGQALIELANTALQLQVIQQESVLNQAITQLQSNEIVLEQNRINNERSLAELDYNIIRDTRSINRRDVLIKTDSVSHEERDNVRDQLDYELKIRPLQAKSNEIQEAIRQRQLPLIHDQLAQLQQNLVTVRSKLDELHVRAPMAGQVTDIILNLGESHKEGDRLVTITPATGIKISADIDEYFLGRVQAGQKAVVQVNGADLTLTASRLYPQVKDGRFILDLTFDNAAPTGMTPGQSVQGKLQLGDDRPAMVLPAGAFLEETGGDWIFVVNEDGASAAKRRIKLGRRSAEQVEILSGLEPGQRVIVSDYSGLSRIDRIDISK